MRHLRMILAVFDCATLKELTLLFLDLGAFSNDRNCTTLSPGDIGVSSRAVSILGVQDAFSVPAFGRIGG